MNILLIFFNLFKPRNWLILLAIIFNVFLCVICGYFIIEFIDKNFAVQYELYICLGIAAIFILFEIILMTPVGEWVLRLEYKMVELERNEYTEPIYQIFDEVKEKAIKRNKFVSKKIKLYYSDDESINAFALGSRTVCIYKGLLNLPLNQIKGILAHEFGHINYYDSYISIIALHGNALFKPLFKLVMLPFILIGCLIDGFINALLKRNKNNYFELVSALFRAIRDIVIIIVDLFTSLCFIFRSKLVEFRADAYSNLIDEKENLTEALTTFLEYEGNKKANVFTNLLSTHPRTEKRIEKLNQLT